MANSTFHLQTPIGWLRITDNGRAITHIQAHPHAGVADPPTTPLQLLVCRQINAYFQEQLQVWDVPRTARHSLSATRMERPARHTVWSNAQLQRHSTKHRPTAGCSRRRQRLSAQSHSAPHSLPPRRRQKPSTDRICRRVGQQTHIAANGTAICCGNMRIFL